MASRACIKCSSKIPPQTRICPSCGTPNPAAKSGSGALVVVLVAVIVLAAAGAAALFLLPKDSTSTVLQQLGVTGDGRMVECTQDPLLAFEVGRTLRASELPALLASACPSTRENPDQTISFLWQGRTFVLTLERQSFDGFPDQVRLVSLKAQ